MTEIYLGVLILDGPLIASPWHNRFGWFFYDGTKYVVGRVATNFPSFPEYRMVITSPREWNPGDYDARYAFVIRRDDGTKATFSTIMDTYIDKATFKDKPTLFAYSRGYYMKQFECLPYADFMLENGNLI